MSKETNDRICAIKLLRQNGLMGPADDLELLNDVEREATADGFGDENGPTEAFESIYDERESD